MAEVFDFGLQQHKIKMDGKFFENNLFAVAGDTGRRLEVQLLDSNNLVQNTTGISLRLNADVAGQATYAEATLVDATKGLYELDLPNGMLIAPGNWQFQWQIIGTSGEKLHSFSFTGSVGSNLSEGGSEATNFYLNADELKQMQEDLVNGTFNSEVLETNIAEKLTDLETQYAPKLTEVTAQLAQTNSEKIGGGIKAEPEDLSATTLGLLTGTGGPINLLSIPQDHSVTDEKIAYQSNIVVKKIGKNRINLEGFTDGFYINFNTGGPLPLVGYGYTDYLPITPNATWTLSNQSDGTLSKALEQMAFYSSESTSGFISGLANSGTKDSVTFTTPSNAAFVRLSLRTTIKNKYQLELGSKTSHLEPFRYQISNDDLPEVGNEPTILNVSKTGGDFANIRAALNTIVNAGKYNRYIIHLQEGLYNVRDEYTSAEISNTSFIGITIPDYVDLIGVGDKEKTIIELTLDTSIFDGVTRGRVSTIAKKGDGIVDNITVSNTNGRYAIHDDYNYQDMKRSVKNCRFLKYGSGLEQAYGGGVWSGSDFEFENCYFYTDGTGIPFSFHNNINFSKPSKIKLKTNTFENKAGLTAIRFGSMGSGQKDVVEMEGNRIKGQIKLFEEQSNGVGIDFNIKGYGNDIVPIEVVNTHSTQQLTYDLVGQTKRMNNGHTAVITKGTIVRQNSWGSAVSPLGSANPIFYYGIAMEDIPVGGIGFVRIGGYLPISETGLTLVLGDKVGLVDGQLAKITTGDYIGVVTINNFIKLK